MSLKRDPIRAIIVYGYNFRAFYKEQSEKVKEKLNLTIGLVRDLRIIPERYFKHIAGTDLYEISVILGNNIYRIFCLFDHGDRVILLNGF